MNAGKMDEGRTYYTLGAYECELEEIREILKNLEERITRLEAKVKALEK